MAILRAAASWVPAIGAAMAMAMAGCGDNAGRAGNDGGAGSADAATDAAIDAATDAATDAAVDAQELDAMAAQVRPPFDWVGVVGTGQSLSIGATAGVMTTAQPFHNLKLVDTGPAPQYPIDDTGAPAWAAVPLVEPIRNGSVAGTGAGYGDGQYPRNIAGETPHSAMANALTALFAAHGGAGEYVTAHSVVGWSGHCLSDINKAGGKRAYPASLHEATVWKGLAAAAGKTFGYGGLILTHGECDAGNAGYGAGLFALWQDYNTDLKAITGQTKDVVLLVSQQSTEGVNNYGNSAVQVWQQGVAHPGQIVCVGPKYQYAYSSDNLHFQAPGYARLGEKYAEVFDLIVNQGVAWKPLQPNKIDRAGAVLTITFDVPNPPLAWDEHLAPPHQTVNTAWAQGRGFEVKDAAGAPLTINSAVIAGNTVVLTLAAAPVGALTVGYALTQDGAGLQGGTAAGMHGQLRDSDELVAYDAETVEANVTAGSAIVTSTAANGFARRAAHDLVVVAGSLPADTIVSSVDAASQLTLSASWAGATGKAQLAIHHDLHNYCVHFALPVP